jgi:hypothetical protein
MVDDGQDYETPLSEYARFDGQYAGPIPEPEE